MFGYSLILDKNNKICIQGVLNQEPKAYGILRKEHAATRPDDHLILNSSINFYISYRSS